MLLPISGSCFRGTRSAWGTSDTIHLVFRLWAFCIATERGASPTSRILYNKNTLTEEKLFARVSNDVQDCCNASFASSVRAFNEGSVKGVAEMRSGRVLQDEGVVRRRGSCKRFEKQPSRRVQQDAPGVHSTLRVLQRSILQ